MLSNVIKHKPKEYIMPRKNFKPAITAYILECLTEEDHGLDNPTDAELFTYCKNRFYSEYGFSVPRIGLHNSVREWLLGLAISCEYSYFEIEQLLRKWGIIEGNITERKLDSELDQYWTRLSNVLVQQFAKIK